MPGSRQPHAAPYIMPALLATPMPYAPAMPMIFYQTNYTPCPMQPLDTPASKENVDPQHPQLMVAAAALQNTDGRRSKKHKTDAQSTRNYAQALRKWELLAAANKQLTFGTADVDAVGAAVSEFNIRKRMIPRVLVFNSRARQAEVIKLAGEDVTADGLAASVLGFLAENPTNENGDCLRLTLAIGGKEEV